MMFFRKKRRRPSQDNAPWMKWLLLFFVLYAVFIHERPDTKDNPNEFRKVVDSAKEDLNSSNIVDFNGYKEMIFPSLPGALRIKDMALGTGIPAVCGQEATVTYSTYFADGKPYTDVATAENPMRVIIGEHKAMPVFEHGVIGMQPGGTRSIFAPDNYTYGQEGFAREDVPKNALMRFDISLVGVSPPLPNPDTALYRITYVRQGVGQAVLCGERVKIHATVWGMDGKKLFSTHDNNGEPLQFTLGLSEVIMGLEQGIVGMTMGEMRTLIIPPEFQKPLRKEIPDIKIPLPANQTILVDVETVE